MSQPIVILPDPPAPPEPLGLIAGGGKLPLLVAQGMKKSGHPVHVLGLSGQYEPEIRDLADRFREVGALRVGSWIRALKRMQIRYAVMVGRVDKARILQGWSVIMRNAPDLLALRLYLRNRKDRRSHVLLAMVADALSAGGIELIDSTTHIQHAMATMGTLTDTRPTPGQNADIEFGWPLLLDLLRIDVGQAIAVRERDVIAVEAVEGTDRMIERAGKLCRHKGWTLLKAARAGHDRRSDVPTIGPDTIQNLRKAGGRCLAIAEGDVIMIDKHETIALADKLGVAIVGMPSA